MDLNKYLKLEKKNNLVYIFLLVIVQIKQYNYVASQKHMDLKKQINKRNTNWDPPGHP
jgi:hypothetical protein